MSLTFLGALRWPFCSDRPRAAKLSIFSVNLFHAFIVAQSGKVILESSLQGTDRSTNLWKTHHQQPPHAPASRISMHLTRCHCDSSWPINHQKWCLGPISVNLCILSLFQPCTCQMRLLEKLLKFYALSHARTSSAREIQALHMVFPKMLFPKP